MLSNILPISVRAPGKQLPWATLALLLSAYAILGMFLAELPNVWLSWEIAIATVFLVTIVFAHPRFNREWWLSNGLRSDVFAFAVMAIAAALVSVVLLWLHIFLKIVAILSAEALVRLELRQSNFGVAQSFGILMITSWVGLGLGWFVNRLI
ncbi:MAG: hypothetical protein HY785_05015 [Oscillatoriophycideae cyanobacterium NC_groundwater_1537_Pr4_S-0.65um_50_18]|nr:hypothetical protein [Oscillatoriophycideae cyanobacterium NC_groundwater_1537_Pr4_S-0.65um_50_18]